MQGAYLVRPVSIVPERETEMGTPASVRRLDVLIHVEEVIGIGMRVAGVVAILDSLLLSACLR